MKVNHQYLAEVLHEIKASNKELLSEGPIFNALKAGAKGIGAFATGKGVRGSIDRAKSDFAQSQADDREVPFSGRGARIDYGNSSFANAMSKSQDNAAQKANKVAAAQDRYKTFQKATQNVTNRQAAEKQATLKADPSVSQARGSVPPTPKSSTGPSKFNTDALSRSAPNPARDRAEKVATLKANPSVAQARGSVPPPKAPKPAPSPIGRKRPLGKGGMKRLSAFGKR